VIVAGNFKTNMTRQGTRVYMNALENFLVDPEISQQVIVFPPSTALDTHEGKANMGAQNAFAVENGAFTGEIGLEQLEEFGIDTILIGHSERRHVLGESQEMMVEKFNYFKDKGFTIVYCIGEPLEIREESNDALMAYLDAQLEGIDIGYDRLIIAYEPVWAIGTGLTPDDNDIELIHGALRKKIDKPLLYGGSVKPGNAAEIMAIDNVDGVLVGGASLVVEDFCGMITAAQQIVNKRLS
jgi:triosephosphate isomerase